MSGALFQLNPPYDLTSQKESLHLQSIKEVINIMLGQEGKKVVIKGAQAQEVRAALARALSASPHENERKSADTCAKNCKSYPIEWK